VTTHNGFRRGLAVAAARDETTRKNPVQASVVACRSRAKRMFAASEPPSASLPIRDILFPLVVSGWNGAEFGALRPHVRTNDTGRGARFGPFLVSLGPLSQRQPNHGHFGTDVESSIIQRVGGLPKGSGFERIPLGRSEPGSNRLVQFVCFMPQSGPVIRRLRPAGRDPKPKSAHRTSGRVLLVAHHPMPGWSLISARIVRQGRYMVFNDDLLRGSRSVHWAAVEPIAGEFRLENIPVITCGGP
jgi:hypothetical protein